MAQLDEQIAKLNKEKKNMDEANKATQEELAKETEKCNGLNKLKQKLERTLDEVSSLVLFLSNVFSFIYQLHCRCIICWLPVIICNTLVSLQVFLIKISSCKNIGVS